MAQVELEEHNSNGHSDQEVPPESTEQLQAVKLELDKISRGAGKLVTFGKEELSLMQTMLRSVTEEYKEQVFWRMCSFLDDDEAYDHVAAFYEAKELGMDIGFNVAYAFALCSAHRQAKGVNLIEILTDTLQQGKWASPPGGKNKHGNGNPRSPLSN